MGALAEALKHDYQSEIKTFPREEWAVRRGVLTTARYLNVIDDFMSMNPKLSARGKDAVESLRQTCRKRADLVEGVVKMGRFKLTEAEIEQDSQLTQEHLQRVKDIGQIIDG